MSRYAYSGDWAWVLGGVDPSASLEHANSLTSSQAEAIYDERCAYHLNVPFMPDDLPATMLLIVAWNPGRDSAYDTLVYIQ